jgi:hypothetical protein
VSSDHEVLAKDKLGTAAGRSVQLDRLSSLLAHDEVVVTMAEGLFRSPSTERRGLAVLTTHRLLCVERDARPGGTLGFALSGITSIEAALNDGTGDACRGGLTFVCDGAETEVRRIYPSERAAEIAHYVGGTAGA